VNSLIKATQYKKYLFGIENMNVYAIAGVERGNFGKGAVKHGRNLGRSQTIWEALGKISRKSWKNFWKLGK